MKLLIYILFLVSTTAFSNDKNYEDCVNYIKSTGTTWSRSQVFYWCKSNNLKENEVSCSETLLLGQRAENQYAENRKTRCDYLLLCKRLNLSESQVSCVQDEINSGINKAESRYHILGSYFGTCSKDNI